MGQSNDPIWIIMNRHVDKNAIADTIDNIAKRSARQESSILRRVLRAIEWRTYFGPIWKFSRHYVSTSVTKKDVRKTFIWA